MYEWDERKRRETWLRHGVDFADVTQFDWVNAVTRPDRRKEYGELRFISYAPIGERVHCVAWTPREGNIRIVMLRKANEREVKRYEREKKLH